MSFQVLIFIVSDLMALFDWEEASFSFSKPEVQNVCLFIFLAAKQVRLTWCYVEFDTGDPCGFVVDFTCVILLLEFGLRSGG